MNLSVNFPYKLESRKGEIIIKDTVTRRFCLHLAIDLSRRMCRARCRRLRWIVGSAVLTIVVVIMIHYTTVLTVGSRPFLPTPSIFTYVEEPQTRNEFKRFTRALSTKGAVCSDLRPIGGSTRELHRNPPLFGPDGMWYVCFDQEIQLNPGSCVVYSFG